MATVFQTGIENLYLEQFVPGSCWNVNLYLFKQHPLTILDGMHGDLHVFPQFLSDIHFCAYLAQKLKIIGLSTYRISPLAGILKSMFHLVKAVSDLKPL